MALDKHEVTLASKILYHTLYDLTHSVKSRMAQMCAHQVFGYSPRFRCVNLHVDHNAQNEDINPEGFPGNVGVADDDVQTLQTPLNVL